MEKLKLFLTGVYHVFLKTTVPLDTLWKTTSSAPCGHRSKCRTTAWPAAAEKLALACEAMLSDSSLLSRKGATERAGQVVQRSCRQYEVDCSSTLLSTMAGGKELCDGASAVVWCTPRLQWAFPTVAHRHHAGDRVGDARRDIKLSPACLKQQPNKDVFPLFVHFPLLPPASY